jgi:hypothetical protein
MKRQTNEKTRRGNKTKRPKGKKSRNEETEWKIGNSTEGMKS